MCEEADHAAASLSGVSGTSLSDRLNYRRKRKRKTVGEIGRVGHHGKQDNGHLDWDHSDEERISCQKDFVVTS